MANNPQYTGGPGPPLRPHMIGSIAPPQNIPPPMPSQFRPVAPMHPSQQYAPSGSQQYIPAMNLGIPPSQNQQMQFPQPLQQVPGRPIPPGHPPPMSQSMPLSNIQLNRPMSSGLPQTVQNLQAPNSFPPSSGGPMPPPPAYAPNTYTTSQYQPMSQSQMNFQSTSVSGPPLLNSGNQNGASFTPVQQNNPPASISTTSGVDSQPKPAEKSSSDWLEHTNNGRRFYYNKKTRQSTWEKPFELMTPIERADASTDWKEYTGPDGRKYYYNRVTKQSKWVIPEELKVAREQAQKAASCIVDVASPLTTVSATQSGGKTPSPATVTPVVAGSAVSPSVSSPCLASSSLKDSGVPTDASAGQSTSPEDAVDIVVAAPESAETADPHAASVDTAPLPVNQSNVVSSKASEPSQNVMEQDADLQDDNKSTGIAGKTNLSAPVEKAIESETVTYTSKQEAKDAFKALLESANVESDWTWEQAMRLIINDKRYAALRSLGERKQTFNEYLSQKRKQEAEERRAKHKKAKEDFRKMLEECSELTSTTRWGKAINMFGNDERFKAIERARDREDMFEEYLAELEKKERAKEEEERQLNIMEYRKFLELCDFIKSNSQWRKIKDRLVGDERCSRLDTMDQLKIFQEYVGDLEKEEEEQKRIQKEEIRKVERKNRDEFRKLMEQHVSDGTLTAKTYWRDYHSKVKDSSTYAAVSSNTSGSTPKELFEDVTEELKKVYDEDRIRIKDAVKSGKVTLSSTWSLQDFKAAIANEISSLPVSENNLKLIFDELLERVREKEEKEAKRRKRLGDEFFNLLCSLKDIAVDSKWEDCLPLFEAREEFRSIGDEIFSRQIFQEYLDQLKEKEDKEKKRKEEKAKREKERERDRRSRDRREKDRGHNRDRGKERAGRDDEDAEPDLDETSVSNQVRKSGKDKDKKHRKRHHDDENDSGFDKNEKDPSRSSHRHSSERKKSRQMEQHTDTPESDNESKHKKQRREHRNGSRRKGDNEDLEDGELGVTVTS